MYMCVMQFVNMDSSISLISPAGDINLVPLIMKGNFVVFLKNLLKYSIFAHLFPNVKLNKTQLNYNVYNVTAVFKM